jgi:hypothetical protein
MRSLIYINSKLFIICLNDWSNIIILMNRIRKFCSSYISSSSNVIYSTKYCVTYIIYSEKLPTLFYYNFYSILFYYIYYILYFI